MICPSPPRAGYIMMLRRAAIRRGNGTEKLFDKIGKVFGIERSLLWEFVEGLDWNTFPVWIF